MLLLFESEWYKQIEEEEEEAENERRKRIHWKPSIYTSMREFCKSTQAQ